MLTPHTATFNDADVERSRRRAAERARDHYRDSLRDCIEALAGFHSPDPDVARLFQAWQAKFYDRLNNPPT